MHESLTHVRNWHFAQTVAGQGGFGETPDSSRGSTVKRVQIRTVWITRRRSAISCLRSFSGVSQNHRVRAPAAGETPSLERGESRTVLGPWQRHSVEK
jgi:hypothetical protein